MAHQLNSQKSAFSIIEVSITILIIGVLIAGITKSSSLYEKYLHSIAKKETRNSPVPANDGLIMWFEATLDESFTSTAREDYESLSEVEKNAWSNFGKITQWFNIAPIDNGLELSQSSVLTAPVYKANCINRLPCAYFNGTDSFLKFSELPLVGKNYTIFIVEKSEINPFTSPLISSSSITGFNDYIQLANNNNSSIFFSTDATENISYNFSDSPYNKALVHTISSNYENYYYYTIPSSGSILMYQYLYENNNEEQTFPPTSATDGNFYSFYSDYLTSALSSNTHYLGHGQVRSSSGSVSTGYFHGGIGELIIYNKRLNAQERKRIQEYLIKKWRITESPQYNVSGSGGNQVVN